MFKAEHGLATVSAFKSSELKTSLTSRRMPSRHQDLLSAFHYSFLHNNTHESLSETELQPGPSVGQSRGPKSASELVCHEPHDRPLPRTHTHLQKRHHQFATQTKGATEQLNGMLPNVQAGRCRPQAEWTATPRVPHKDLSLSSSADTQNTRKTSEANIKKDQSAAESPDCVSGCDDGGRGRGVPALKLQSGGCWVILSFTQALVRVSRSGGTISMSVNTESTTERRLDCHSHVPLSSHFCLQHAQR